MTLPHPHLSQEIIDRATLATLPTALRVLQGYRLADTDEEHVSRLLAYMDAPRRATIADIGSGFGEVARLMLAERPDLRFLLINNNELQTRHSPANLLRVCGDMHAIPLAAAVADGAMFCYSLCHADIRTAMKEAARIVRYGGFLFGFDYDRLWGDNALMLKLLSAHAIPFADLTCIAMEFGWRPVMYDRPDGSDALFRRICANDTAYDLVFGSLVPIVWKMVRA
jgi:SAM-dependent methyltransferase